MGFKKNPPSVVIDDDQAVPFDYLVVQDPKPDKKRMLAELKAGKELPFARLKQTESLRIR